MAHNQGWNEEYALSERQISDYQRDGHIKLGGVASAEEIAPYRQEILKEVELYRKDVKPLEERNTRGKAFLQKTGLWKNNEIIAGFVKARRFAKIAAELMGVSGVRIYHDQALFKEPGGGRTPWHQDQIYWPLDTKHTITMWMPLKDTPAEPVVSYDALKAGDATFHAGWTLHAAPGNPSDQMREIMTVIYYADQTRVAEPDTKARMEGLRVCLPGLNPGDVAAGPMNPLVYSSLE